MLSKTLHEAADLVKNGARLRSLLGLLSPTNAILACQPEQWLLFSATTTSIFTLSPVDLFAKLRIKQ
jgi:hypothetical protein